MASNGLAYGEQKFRQKYSLRIIFALGLLGYLFLGWAYVDLDPVNLSKQRVMAWISAAVVVCGVALWVAIGKTVLTINDQGVRRESIFGVQEISWSQIDEILYLVRPTRVVAPGVAYAPIAILANMFLAKSNVAAFFLTLIGSDGKRLKVTSSFQKANEARGMILDRILPRMVATALAKIQRGETVAFGRLGLSARNVTWEGAPSIPISQISAAEIVGGRLTIQRTGDSKWLPAVDVRSDKIPNALVFLQALESLAHGSKAGKIAPLR